MLNLLILVRQTRKEAFLRTCYLLICFILLLRSTDPIYSVLGCVRFVVLAIVLFKMIATEVGPLSHLCH